MLDGVLQWQLEKEDRLHEQQAVFTAHLMFASGNMKKGMQFEKLVKQIYVPLEDRLSGNANKVQHVGKEEVEKERQKIRERFLTE